MENHNQQKQCPQCGGTGPFGKKANRHDGLERLCKVCINDKQKRRNLTPEGKAATAWQSIGKRAHNRDGNNPTYAGVCVGVTREAFMEWAVPAFTLWMLENPSSAPSVNRIDDTEGYELSNLEIIEWGENSRRRAANKNVHSPKGQAWCGVCRQYLPSDNFRKCTERANGLENKCATCGRKYHREYARKYRAAHSVEFNRYQREWKRKQQVQDAAQ